MAGYVNEKYTDEELKQALIKANGQPTKAAEMLGVDYSGVYRRVRRNPELLEVQKSHRAKTFNDVANAMVFVAMAGIIKEPVIDENGNVVQGQFREAPVDYKTRMTAMQTIMQTFKSDEGIKEELSITTKGSINISDWLKLNNSQKEEESFDE